MDLIITLHPDRLSNPDLDIRYTLPNLLEELSEGRLRSDGYDYTEDQALELYLICEDGVTDPVELARQILVDRLVLGNDILSAAEFRTEESVSGC
jgi:hypothetical protein